MYPAPAGPLAAPTPCTRYTGTYFAGPGCNPAACPPGLDGSCIYWECATPGAYQFFPAGQHHLFVTATFEAECQLSVYTHPSGNVIYLATVPSKTHTWNVDCLTHEDVWSAGEHGIGTGWTVTYDVQYSSAAIEAPCVPAGAYCTYGTELAAPGTFVYYLTPGLVDLVLNANGLLWLAPLFDALYFTSFNAQVLCGAGPPRLPTIDLSTLESSASTVLQIWESVAWPYFCQCKSGTPAPIPYPVPNPPVPTGWPTYPTFPCDNTNLCAAVQQLLRQVAGIQSTLADVQQLVTLLQRYRVPFAYINGAAHSHLTGEGSFAIPRVVGLHLAVTATPGTGRVIIGVPPYQYDLGWCSVLDQDGLINETRLTRTNQTWLPQLAATAMSFGYSLRPGVELQVTELYAEP